MSQADQKVADQKVVQYLSEAYATEMGLVRVLQAQIAIAPRGSYRDGLEKHLAETRRHASRVQKRLGQLDRSSHPLRAVIGVAGTVLAQAVAVGKAPVGLVRGSGGEEKVLKNAKDACASEALEIARYTALERLATSVADARTAELAASIRGDEERMLERLMREIPTLTEAVVAAEVDGAPSYALTKTGAADAARGAGDELTGAARRGLREVTGTVRQARKLPGVARAEGQLKGVVAAEGDLAISDYGSLTAQQIVDRLPGLSQIELAKVEAYERQNGDRRTVLDRIAGLRGQEPWPGYDELTVAEIEAALDERDEQQAQKVAAYERGHKNRAGVLRSVDGAAAGA